MLEATTAQMRPRANVIAFPQPKRKYETQVEFKNRLRQRLDLRPMIGNVLRVGSWMKIHCGDKVYDKREPRHVGTVIAIQGGMVKVRWSNGWLSYIALANTAIAKEEE